MRLSKRYTSIAIHSEKVMALKKVFTALLLLISIFQYAFAENMTLEPKDGLAAYTVMIYMIASDLESRGRHASKDIEEIIHADIDTDRMNVLLYAGGTTHWYSDTSTTENHLFTLTPEGMCLESSFPPYSMCEPNTLADFLTYGYTNYPAQRYALVFWDHGAGPIVGFGEDLLFPDDSFTLPELQEALLKSPFSKERKLEWIGFDACFMQTLETAYVLSDYADYLVASQEKEQSTGWDYRFVKELVDTRDSREASVMVVDTYRKAYTFPLESKTEISAPVTLSVLDLQHMATVETALNALFHQMDNAINWGAFSSISRIRFSTKQVGRVTTKAEYDLIDALDFCDRLETFYPAEITTLRNAIENLIIYNFDINQELHGVSLYAPYSDNAHYEDSARHIYREIGFAAEYAAFMEHFVEEMQSKSQEYMWRVEDMVPEQNEDKTITLALSEEQQNEYRNATFYIMEDVGEDGFGFLGTQSEVFLTEDGILSTTFNGQMLCLSNETTGVHGPASYFQLEKTERYHKGSVRVALQKWDENGDFMSTFQSEFADLQIATEIETGNIVITGVTSLDQDRRAAGKYELNLEDWRTIQIITFVYQPTYDLSGQLLPFSQWRSAGKVYGYEFEIADGIQSGIIAMELKGRKIYGMFVVADVKGNQYASELILLKDPEEKIGLRSAVEKRIVNEVTVDPQQIAPYDMQLFSHEDITVQLCSLGTSDSNQNKLSVALKVTNESSRDVVCATKYSETFINDFVESGASLYCPVPSKSTGEASINFDLYGDTFVLGNIRNIKKIEFTLQLRDVQTYDIIGEQPICISTNYDIEEYYDRPLFPGLSDQWMNTTTLWSGRGLYIEAFSLGINYDGLKLFLLAENNTSDPLYINPKFLAVNDIMLYSSDSVHLLAGNKAIFPIRISFRDLWNAGVFEIKNISIQMHITYAAFFSETFALSGVVEIPIQRIEKIQDATESQPLLVSEAWGTIKAVGLYRTESDYYPYEIRLEIKNATESTIEIEMIEAQINGGSTSLSFSKNKILPGRVLYATIEIPNDSLPPKGQAIETVVLQFRVINVDLSQVISTPPSVVWEP